MTCDNCEKETPEKFMTEFKPISLRSKNCVMEIYSGELNYIVTTFSPKYCINCLRDALDKLTGKIC